jgi:hypothetical protein
MEVRWRYLFRSTTLGKRCTSYNALPTSRKRAADRWSLRHFLPRSSLFMVGKAQKWQGARSGLYGGCSNGVPRSTFSKPNTEFNSDLAPMQFLGFPNHEKGAPRREISKWPTVCNMWSAVRSASLAKGGTSKQRPSPHLHKVPTRSNKVGLRTLQTVLVFQTNDLRIYQHKLNKTSHCCFCSGCPGFKSWLSQLRFP